MDKKVLAYVTGKTHELLEAASCNEDTAQAAKKWLAAVGTAQEKEATAQYLVDLKTCIMPIEGLISFAESEAGEKVFGKEIAAHVAVHAKEIKAAGAVYCDCPACTAVKAILDCEKDML